MSEGGDPACWADRVCPACGLLDERAPDERDGTCPHCGATEGRPDGRGAAPTGESSGGDAAR